MITDLERNDVGRVCEYGTLTLTKEREVMELPNLWHTYSEVQGRLRSDATPSEVISAMFPGGSITGCPKKRAMEHIERLEDLPRNIFTGSIGYVSNGRMDFNICIRTLLIRNGQLEFWAGGGIVMDSDPESEYAECMLKAQKFLEIFK
ncbi:chorismate-binding protein [Candidatus Peregrinibacteria bacterium]|nr:MAG: chorismate-binding protein [Candidatus Peregrinibacteria bacterium]